VGDLDSMVAPGMLHKYHGRALLLMTGACAIGCRYCFRRSFPYAESRLGRQAEREVLDYLTQDTSVEEVILSGGDPLMLSDRRLSELSRALAAIPHVRTLRVHSRLPIVLPSRVTDALVESLTSTRLSAVMVVHANHPNEIDGEVSDALRRLCRSGTTVLNQSVLLKGVNDDAGVLAELSRALFNASALPYYLHLLDRAHGTAHFLVPDERALTIHDALRRLLPGYLVPRMVREDAGEPYKTLV
jgi:EF-P beta-lysylation protein EpmB